MAIRNRRGVYSDFDKTKMVDGEFAVVKSGDPDGSGKAVYISFESGTADRLALFEDLEEYGGKIDKITALGEELPIVNKTVDIPIPTVDISAAAGDIVEFSTGGDNMPMKAVEVSMSPIQDLNGYDHPWPAGGGKNQLKITAKTSTVKGVTFTVNADGSVTVNGTTTENNCFFNLNYAANQIKVPTDTPFNIGMYGKNRPGTLSIQCMGGNGGAKVTYAGIAEFGISPDSTLASTSTTTATWVRLQIQTAGTTINNVTVYPFWCYSSNKMTAYEPYSNICPISGRTGASVVVNSRNVLPCNQNSQTPGGLTITKDRDTSEVTVSGTATANGISNIFYATNDFGGLLKGVEYTATVENSNLYIDVYYYEGSLKKFTNTSLTECTFTIPDTATGFLIRIGWTNGKSFNGDNIGLMIRFASDTDTTYVPRKSTTYPITFTSAGTVYAGTVDVVSGVLTVTHSMINAKDVTWRKSGTNPFVYTQLASTADTSTRTEIWCNIAKYMNVQSAGSNDNIVYWGGVVASDTNNGNLCIMASAVTPVIADWNTYIANNDVQILYKLATPLTYNLTPSQVMSLLGENVVWSPDGTISNLKYSADISLVVADLYSKLSS